jgi:uncharacterized protein (TIGR03437 family)
MCRKVFVLASAWLVTGCIRGYAAEADAVAISANIQAHHLPFGTILDPIFASASSNQIVGYTRCGDSATWTGHYLAAEAFRYKVTQAPDALTNVKNAIAGIKSLADVTGTNLLARCLVTMNSPFAAGIASEEAANGIHTNTSAGYIWVGNTSRDEYLGVIFGLGVAYDMVSDAGVQSSISDLVTRLVDFLMGNAWTIVMPDGSISTTFLVRPDQILTLLQVGRHVNSGHFSTTYDIQRVLLAAAVLAPISVDVASDDSYFKFNLDSITFYNLIRLESSSANTIYKAAYDVLRNHTASHQNAFFNMIDRGLKSPDAARDSQTLVLLDEWLLRPRRDPFVDLTGVVPVCGSQACSPVPVPLRVPTDFLWQRSPFQLTGGGSSVIEGAGIDYILPYWMARFYQVGSAFAVQSGAASNPTVAPASFASLYGSSLSSQTVQAGVQPPPTSLGGISVSVQDASGTARSAPLTYVSPGQINLVVPTGTLPGAATFTVTNGGAKQIAAGSVQEVAPTLFSANATGTGVAAATAIQTIAGNPQVQSPVPVFKCTPSGCTSIPIILGIDTPIFLALYGTGIRNRSSLSNVTVTINGISVPVLYAGPQPEFAGLDQVNVPLTLNLRGSGEANVVLSVDGQISNTVTVNVQ